MKLVLDVGCGGDFPYRVKEAFPDSEYTGLDLNKATTPTIISHANNLPFRNHAFDGVFSSHLLEHLQDEIPCLKEIQRVLIPHGKFVLVVPNFSGHQLTLLRPIAHFLNLIREGDIKTNFTRLFYHCMIDHYREYKVNELVKLLRKLHWKVTRIDFYGFYFVVFGLLPRRIYLRLQRIPCGKYSFSIEIQACKN